MNERAPHEDQSSTQVLVIVGFLTCLAVVLLSVVGIFGLRVYSVKRAAIEAEMQARMQADRALMEARMQAEKAIAEASEGERVATEAIRQADFSKPMEIEADR